MSKYTWKKNEKRDLTNHVRILTSLNESKLVKRLSYHMLENYITPAYHSTTRREAISLLIEFKNEIV